MIGAFFNPSKYFTDAMYNMFDFRKFFDFSKLDPEFNLAKFWDINKKNITSAASINKALTENMSAIAEKQALMVKENTEDLTTAMKEMLHGHMTPQKTLEIQEHFYRENAAKNMRYAKELAEMYTATTKHFFKAWSDQVRQHMDEQHGHMDNRFGEQESEWCTSSTKKKKS